MSKKLYTTLGILLIIVVIVVLSMNNQSNIKEAITDYEKTNKNLPSSITFKKKVSIEFVKYTSRKNNKSRQYFIIFEGRDVIEKDKTNYWVYIKGSQKRKSTFEKEKSMNVYQVKGKLGGKKYYVYIKGEVHKIKLKK